MLMNGMMSYRTRGDTNTGGNERDHQLLELVVIDRVLLFLQLMELEDNHMTRTINDLVQFRNVTQTSLKLDCCLRWDQ